MATGLYARNGPNEQLRLAKIVEPICGRGLEDHLIGGFDLLADGAENLEDLVEV